MIVRKTQKKLLKTVSHSRVVLLTALPRAGRTELMKAIVLGSAEGSQLISGKAFLENSAQDIQKIYAGQILCVNRIQTQQVVEIVEIIHFCLSSKQSAPKFVLAGCNAKTEQELCGSLIGPITAVELPPIQIMEHYNDGRLDQISQGPIQMATPQEQASNLPTWDHHKLWLRGGLPESLNADSDEDSFIWRRNYLKNMLQQDFRSWGVNASDRLADVLLWVANINGREFDVSDCGSKLGVGKDSVRNSLNVLERLGVLRSLRNWPAGSNKSSKLMSVYYLRDCGLLHALLGVRNISEFSDVVAKGHSWEGFAIETIINAAPETATPAFYRDKAQNEIDLVLEFPGVMPKSW